MLLLFRDRGRQLRLEGGLAGGEPLLPLSEIDDNYVDDCIYFCEKRFHLRRARPDLGRHATDIVEISLRWHRWLRQGSEDVGTDA